MLNHIHGNAVDPFNFNIIRAFGKWFGSVRFGLAPAHWDAWTQRHKMVNRKYDRAKIHITYWSDDLQLIRMAPPPQMPFASSIRHWKWVTCEWMVRWKTLGLFKLSENFSFFCPRAPLAIHQHSWHRVRKIEVVIYCQHGTRTPLRTLTKKKKQRRTPNPKW